MDEMQQQIAVAIHVIEQNGEFMRGTIAPQVAAYYLALVRAGVPDQHAVWLAQDVQTRYLDYFLPEKLA